MYNVIITKKFKKDYKRILRSGLKNIRKIDDAMTQLTMMED
jgi:hypothetical protein